MTSRLVLAITGASGSIYAEKLLERCLRARLATYVIFSPTAQKVIKTELSEGLLVHLAQSSRRQRFAEDAETCQCAESRGLSRESLEGLRLFAHDDLYAPVASGSLGATHMVVAPASMGSVARIAGGMSSNLIERCADVMMKESRRLVIMPRETPLSLIHLRNLVALSEAGVRIVPAMPGFYMRPNSISELVDFVVERLCDQLGIEALATQNSIHWNAKQL